jgi:hypothetical protein
VLTFALPIHPAALDSHRQLGRVSHLKETGEISDTCYVSGVQGFCREGEF